MLLHGDAGRLQLTRSQSVLDVLLRITVSRVLPWRRGRTGGGRSGLQLNGGSTHRLGTPVAVENSRL
jgi:hypothetical protein